jgi:hypothetical protein
LAILVLWASDAITQRIGLLRKYSIPIANMNAVTSKHGPSFKAFLVVPLVGAFFVDLINAMVIKFFIALPMLQQAPLPGG